MCMSGVRTQSPSANGTSCIVQLDSICSFRIMPICAYGYVHVHSLKVKHAYIHVCIPVPKPG